MTKRDGMFWFRLVVLALAVVAMVLSIIAATERRIAIMRAARAALAPDGTVYVTYRYPIGGEHQMRATAWSYGEWVSALRSKGWRVKEAWK